ncbi:MAG TPA: VWA domain-containing protein [Flavobacteriales bacterium]|nr:VWA domain-containing protein [Flavobacteriales bacterium]
MRRSRDLIAGVVWCLLALAGVVLALVFALRRYEAASAWCYWLLLLLLPLVGFHLLRTVRRRSMVRLSTLHTVGQRPLDILAYLRHLPMAMGILGTGLLIIGLARPQSEDNWQDVKREGIDIVIALDISASMLAKDFKPDRLQASKRVAMDFVDDRPNDRIGLVVYEGEAFTQCPITTDHRVLKELFADVAPGLIEGGTAVGSGLATALNRLRESEAKSKVVILLTDGVSNAGTIQPIDAARIAEQLGIRVYTIGVGTRGKALSPVARYATGQYRYEYVDVDLDEATMQRIADLTGGKYFRATDEAKLKEIYGEIDRLEKTRIKVTEHRSKNEEYLPFVLVGASLLFAAAFLDRTILRSMA